MQLVAIQVADKARQIQYRSRPARGGPIDDAKRIAAFLGIRRDHDRNVMIGERQRQLGVASDIKRQQLDTGLFQQEFDRRISAHVDGCRQRQHPQSRPRRRARRAVQPVKRQRLCLDQEAGLLFAKQLRDQ